MPSSDTQSPEAKPATIKDVARMAGVSVTTVSNVLNGRTGAMSADTLARVQSVIAELNYRPSPLARSLVTGRSIGTAPIGVYLTRPAAQGFLEAVAVVEPTAHLAGFDLLLTLLEASEAADASLPLPPNATSGAIILTDASALAAPTEGALPLVIVACGAGTSRLDSVSWDLAGGVAAAVDHLASFGHTRIAFLRGAPSRLSAAESYRGYQLGLDKNGLSFRPDWVLPCDPDTAADSWRQAVRQILATRPRPTAIIAASDRVAAAAMSECQRAGIRVPEEIAVVGVGDEPLCTWLNPTLTSVKTPVVAAVQDAMTLLLRRIASPVVDAEQITLPCPLTVRESCGAAHTEPKPPAPAHRPGRHEKAAAQERLLPDQEDRATQSRLF